MHDIERIIYNFAKLNSIIIGFCSADKLDIEINNTPFVRYSKEQRTNPKLSLSSAASIIAFGVGYRKREDYQLDGQLRSKLSIGAVGLDYHIKLNDIANDLDSLIKSKVSNYESKIFVDTGALAEVEFAKRCGLGWRGKNGLINSSQFGSFFNIGLIVTNLHLTPSKPISPPCGDCAICSQACPTNALESGFNVNKCISYMTQKKNITKEQSESLNGSLYGCDICQEVCPHNKDKYIDGVITNIDDIRPMVDYIINLDDAGFKERFENTAIFWRGREIIQRNAKSVKR